MKMIRHLILSAGFLTAGALSAQNNLTGKVNASGPSAASAVHADGQPEKQTLKAEKKYPLPPFTLETALQKVQLAEDAWNSQDPERISKAYTIDSEWRNRDKFVNGRVEIIKFLANKWKKERNYKLKKEYWAHTDNRIAVRFEYEYMDENGNWFRAYGNENWEFDENGLMAKRYASINDLPITEEQRKLK